MLYLLDVNYKADGLVITVKSRSNCMGMRCGSTGCEPTRWDAKILQKMQISRSRQCRGSFAE